MSKLHVLVTGGGGFLGSHIVKELLSRGYEVTSLSRNDYPFLKELGVKTLKCDLTKKADLLKYDFNDYDAVIHTAAKAGVWGDYDKYYSINYLGSKNLLKAVENTNVKNFIYTSSPSVVFGDSDIVNGDESLNYPENFLTSYAKTKAMAEKEILESSSSELQTVSLRPHLIWGPGDPHLIPRIIAKARENKLKLVGTGENLVDIIYVKNAARAHVDVLESLANGRSIGGQAYFIGQERPVKIWEFINQIISANKINPIEASISFKAAFYIGWIFELVYKFLGILSPEPPMTRFVALQLAKNHYFSHAKAQKDFNYKPYISIEQGLKEMFDEREITN